MCCDDPPGRVLLDESVTQQKKEPNVNKVRLIGWAYRTHLLSKFLTQIILLSRNPTDAYVVINTYIN